jgi:hypothetical protein
MLRRVCLSLAVLFAATALGGCVYDDGYHHDYGRHGGGDWNRRRHHRGDHWDYRHDRWHHGRHHRW